MKIFTTMDENKTINYKPDDGPVTLQIKPGYATLGSYSVAYALNGQLLNLGSGKLSDTVPDVYTLPVSAEELSECTFFITGNYMPSPTHDQISVSYTFLQKGLLLKGENPVEIMLQQPVLSSNHTINFNRT